MFTNPSDAPHTPNGRASLPRLLSISEERALCARILAGDVGARNELVQANLRLAWTWTGHYLQGVGGIGALTMEDLYQEACIGLMDAAKRFDGRGKFSTYAVIWIRQAIGRAIENQADMIRMPSYVHAAHRRVRRASDAIESTGATVTPAALADAGITTYEAQAARGMVRQPITYDVPVLEDEDTSAKDMLPEPADEITERLAALDSAHLLTWIREQLTPREWRVYRRRIVPAIGDQRVSLREAAHTLGVTRERTRQVQFDATLKLIAAGLCPDGTIQPDGPRARRARLEITTRKARLHDISARSQRRVRAREAARKAHEQGPGQGQEQEGVSA
jgi:RNA polymerase primary sigma factor